MFWKNEIQCFPHLSLGWSIHCNSPPINMVNFLQILKISIPELVSECEVWGVFGALNASSVFWLIVVVLWAKFIIKIFLSLPSWPGERSVIPMLFHYAFQAGTRCILLGDLTTNDLETFSHRAWIKNMQLSPFESVIEDASFCDDIQINLPLNLLKIA